MGRISFGLKTAFGISFTRPVGIKRFETKEGEMPPLNSRARSTNAAKLMLTLPIVGLFFGIVALLPDKEKRKPGIDGKLLGARGILCGLGVGIPLVLATDIIVTLGLQIKNAVDAHAEKKAAHNQAKKKYLDDIDNLEF